MWEKKKKNSEDASFHVYTFNRFIALQGVSHSGPNSTDISLCYANRSAALFHLGQYEVSIRMPGVIGEDLQGVPQGTRPSSLLLSQNTKIGPCATG